MQRTTLAWNERVELFGAARIDPHGCGCTDCLTGESVPQDRANDTQLWLMAAGVISNATRYEHDTHIDLTATIGGSTVEAPDLAALLSRR